jgi:hypothetical protein
MSSEPLSADWLTAYATVGLVGCTVVGFVFVWLQLRRVKETIQADAQDSLYGRYQGLLAMLADKPHLYPYLYEKKWPVVADPDHPHLRAELALACEAVLAVLEHAAMFENEVPGAAFGECWKPYADVRMKASVVLQKFYDKNRGIYASALRQHLDCAGSAPQPERSVWRWARNLVLAAARPGL